MSAVGSCRLCSGELRLRYRGSAAPATPEAMSPSCHVPGRHGDLFACRRCGTVQQPALPGGRALHDLYRGMADPLYLREEAGRRATARRLLELVERSAGV